MKKERYDNIEYNDEWQSVPVVRAEPVPDNDDEDAYEEDDFPYDEDFQQENGIYKELIPKRKESQNPQPVIKLQLLFAVLAVAAAFALRGIGGDIYAVVKDWYFKNLNNSLIVSLEEVTEPAQDTQPSSDPTAPTQAATALTTQDTTAEIATFAETGTYTAEENDSTVPEVQSEESTAEQYTQDMQANEETYNEYAEDTEEYY